MSLGYGEAAVYAFEMLDALERLVKASNSAYLNGRVDANPIDDLNMMSEFMSAAPDRMTAKRAFAYVVENDIEMPSVNPLDETDSTLYEACLKIIAKVDAEAVL